MKHRTKRFFATLLCAFILLGMIPASIFSVGAASVIGIQNGTGTRGAIQVGQSLAYRAKVNGAFTAFSFTMPTWSTTDSSCTLSLYKWAGSFEATVATTPVATKDFNPCKDNAVNTVTFDEQPAGEYLFHIGNAKGKVGVWANTGVSNSLGFFYTDGTEGRGEPELKITFTETPDEPFGACEPSADARVQKDPYVNASNGGITNLSSSAGMLVETTAPFVKVEFKFGTYMVDDLKVTLSVYKWDTDYDTTTAGTPLAEEAVIMADNQYAGMTFEELPADKYLILASKPTGTTALYYYGKVDECIGVVYKDGYSMEVSMPEYPQMRLTFTKDMEDKAYFLPCTATETEIDGNHTAPDEYVIPADSLLNTHKVQPDTWVFTDGLGRVSLTNADVGNPRDDKTLAIFYWTWHLSGSENTPRNNIQKLSEQYPEAMNDYDHELWSTLPSSNFGWNESIYGNYRSDDSWVLRRQAELLANAGVDVIFTDNTNGTNTWRAAYTELMEVWDDAQTNGAVDVPKVSFMLPFSDSTESKQQLYSLYLDIFRRDKYPNLWYYLDGKPMLMAHSSNLSASATTTEKEILNFFTFRANYPGYSNSKPSFSNWGWLSTYPQAVYYKDRATKEEGKPEQITVGVAMNHNYTTGSLTAMNGETIMGRSYTSTYQNRYEEEGSEASKWGYNFAEQFTYALEVDPSVIFVTGWNEWTAGRYETWGGVENAFPDQYNDEFSRDIEPSKGDLQDHYYYQLVNFARQYKGATAIPTPSENQTIDLTAGSDQWQSVAPYYASYIGNTDDRDAQGYGIYYTETSGRNDIIGAQVARDDEYVYFHVECAEDITPYTDSLWMTLYLDTAGDGKLDGWNTFEYVVNKSAASADTLVLEKFTGTGYASEKVADVAYTVDGRYMTVKIAKSDLGLTGHDYTVNFAWTDNVHDEGDDATFSGDIMDFYISGDVAPGGRFKYSFISTTENSGASTGMEDTTPDTAGEDTEPATAAESDGNGTTADSDNDGAVTEPAKSGCTSTLALGTLTASVVAAAFVLRKKKED